MAISELLASAGAARINELPAMAVELAGLLLMEAFEEQTRDDRHTAERMAAMMEDPAGKRATVSLFDQVFRSSDPSRVADQLGHLLDRSGVPHYFAGWERVALGLGAILGRFLPNLIVPAIVSRVRAETAGMILPSEEHALVEHLAHRQRDGVRMNINYLGEAILGEEEAENRLRNYLDLLRRPDIEYISVKISSIFSQVDLVAADATLASLKEKLRILYRTAEASTFNRDDGTPTKKFVNLDMESYGDLHLTFRAFTESLDLEEFRDLTAGIVLQAYLPDSFPLQRNLTDWALRRVATGGAPVKLRIVKGANLAMERADAAWHGWPQAPYSTKAEVDSNFTRMVRYGTHPDRAPAVRLGIGSHNLFDIAHALLLRAHHHTEEHVEIEMLEGMVNHQARAVRGVAGGLLLYAPIVEEKEFRSAIAYLIRRLDENTDPENFLRDLFGMVPGDQAFRRQANRFMSAASTTVEEGPRRTQDRCQEELRFHPSDPFMNVVDTDFSLPANQEWARRIAVEWRERHIADIRPNLPVTHASTEWKEGRDPSRPDRIAYRWMPADPDQVEHAIDRATTAAGEWAAVTTADRRRVLDRCAEELAQRRSDLIGAMMLDAGKTIAEADVEVSEAIDFALYYGRSLDQLDTDGAQAEPLGVVTVVPPWNFPLAIPAGGILGALAAGNTVLFKPASSTVLVGSLITEAFWQAGVPRDVLQFIPTAAEVGGPLIADPRVDGVILTGAWETGRMFLDWRPDLRLSAETSGKNALIVSAMSDRDQAVRDLVKSAFGHNGQKCSAASLGILESEVYDDPAFMRQMADAVRSLPVGTPWDLSAKVTPVIREPDPGLERGLTRLDPGETWLVEPGLVSGTMWRPGVRLGVQPGSFFHSTECFGPVLGLMRAPDLATAIAWVNASEFALTGGLESLDEREIAHWVANIEVGNGYVNRHITGAIVRRQPFGGWKKSSFGSGAKAGGPNYVASLMRWHEGRLPTNLGSVSKKVYGILEMTTPSPRAMAAAGSYAAAWHDHYSRVHDPSGIRGEINGFRYLPAPRVLVRVYPDGEPEDALLAVLAARTCGTTVDVSLADGTPWPWHLFPLRVLRESDATLASRLRLDDRIRVIGSCPRRLWESSREVHARIFDDRVVAQGRLELRWYLREQAMSIRTHRYGNLVGLGERALE